MKHWPHATFYTFNILPFTFYHSTHSTHSTFYTFYKHETLHTQIHSSSPFGSQTILQLTCCINWTPFGFGAHSILHHVAWHFELNIAHLFYFFNQLYNLIFDISNDWTISCLIFHICIDLTIWSIAISDQVFDCYGMPQTRRWSLAMGWSNRNLTSQHPLLKPKHTAKTEPPLQWMRLCLWNTTPTQPPLTFYHDMTLRIHIVWYFIFAFECFLMFDIFWCLPINSSAQGFVSSRFAFIHHSSFWDPSDKFHHAGFHQQNRKIHKCLSDVNVSM